MSIIDIPKLHFHKKGKFDPLNNFLDCRLYNL